MDPMEAGAEGNVEGNDTRSRGRGASGGHGMAWVVIVIDWGRCITEKGGSGRRK